MKLSEYKLLKEYIVNSDWFKYYNVPQHNYIDDKFLLKNIYNSLEFKSYLLNYYLNEIKQEIRKILKIDKILNFFKKLLRIENEKM